MREGYKRTAINNLIINNSLHPHAWYPNSGDVFAHNIVFGAYKPAVMARAIAPDGKWGTKLDSNLFATNNDDRIRFAKNGCDANSLVGDPLFVDAKHGDFRVKDDSPSLTVGFRNFPMNEFGVQKASLKRIAKVPAFPELKISIVAKSQEKSSVSQYSWLGVVLDEPKGEALSAFGASFDAGGIVLTKVKEGSQADQLGFKSGDMIQKINGVITYSVKKMQECIEIQKGTTQKNIPRDPNQRVIDFEGLDVLPQEEEAIKEAQEEIISYKRQKPEREKKQPVRLPLPEELRREEETIEPEGIDQNWVRSGEEVTEVLEFKPGEMYVRRIIRPRYAKKPGTQVNSPSEGDQRQEHIRIAALPALPLPRSNAGASLLTELLMGKYLFHLPFHRQLAIFRLAGFSPPGSTVNGWFQGAGDLLRAMYYRLREIVLSCDYIQVDESTVPVINDEKHRAVKAYMWMVRSVMENLVFFHYDKGSRAQKVVVGLLKDFKGAVQSDGYEAYSIYENKKGVLLLGCWSHARSYQYL